MGLYILPGITPERFVVEWVRSLTFTDVKVRDCLLSQIYLVDFFIY